MSGKMQVIHIVNRFKHFEKMIIVQFLNRTRNKRSSPPDQERKTKVLKLKRTKEGIILNTGFLILM